MGGARQIRLGNITDTRVLGSDRALSYQQYPPKVRGDVVEGGAGDGDQAGGYFGGVMQTQKKHQDDKRGFNSHPCLTQLVETID